MFVIRNITSNDVVLDDLRIILGPHKEIDIDRVCSRSVSEYSEKLRNAVSQKKVKVVNKDMEHLSSSMSPADMKNMEDRIKGEFHKQLGAKDSQISDLTQAVHALVKQLKEQKPVIIQGGSSNNAVLGEKDSIRTDISDDIATKVHAKAMRRLEQGVSGHIEKENVTQKDESLKDTLDQLKGLKLE